MARSDPAPRHRRRRVSGRGRPGRGAHGRVHAAPRPAPRCAPTSARAPIDRRTTAATVLSNSELAAELYRSLAHRAGNFVFSPYAISVALAEVGRRRGGRDRARAGRHPAPAGRPGPAVRAEHARPADRHPGRRPAERRAPGAGVDRSPDLAVGPARHVGEATLPRRPGSMVRHRHAVGGLPVRSRRGAHRGEQLDARPELVPVRRPRRRRAGHAGHATADDGGHVHRRAVGPTLRRQPHAPDDLPSARRQHDGRHDDEHHEPRGSGLRPRRRLAGRDAPVPRSPAGHGPDRARRRPLRRSAVAARRRAAPGACSPPSARRRWSSRCPGSSSRRPSPSTGC